MYEFFLWLRCVQRGPLEIEIPFRFSIIDLLIHNNNNKLHVTRYLIIRIQQSKKSNVAY